MLPPPLELRMKVVAGELGVGAELVERVRRGAEAGDERLLVRAGRQPGDLGAGVPGHLDRDHPDTAGGALDQHPVTAAHPRHLEYRELRGEAGHRQRGAGGEIERGGQLEHLLGRDRHRRCVAAEERAGDDRIARREIADVLADLRDLAADLVARDERPLRCVGVQPEPHLDVGEVDARVRDVDRDLVVARGARGDLARGHGRGRSVLGNGDVAVHGSSG